MPEQHITPAKRPHERAQHVMASLCTCRPLNGEVDDELQRGSRGKRRRYFLAAVLRREQNAHLKRLHVHSLRPPDAPHGRQPSGSRLSLPMPTFMPLAEEREQPGESATAACFARNGGHGLARCWGALLWLEYAGHSVHYTEFAYASGCRINV